MSLHSRFDPETLKQMDGLLLRGTQLVSGFLAGAHRNDRYGQAIEFSEHRPYSLGDDPRRIDWRVLARRDEYFVKQFEDETNLVGSLVLDHSASMQLNSSSRGLSKAEYAQLIALTVAQFLFGCHDAVSLAVFNGSENQFIEPTTQKNRWLDMVKLLDSTSPSGEVQFDAIGDFLRERLPSRSLAIIVSDFLTEPTTVAAACQRLRANQVEVILFQVLDRVEAEFSIRGRTEFVDLETADRLAIDPDCISGAYRDEFANHQSSLMEIVRQFDADFCQFFTDEPLSSVLPAFVSARMRGLQNYRAKTRHNLPRVNQSGTTRSRRRHDQ